MSAVSLSETYRRVLTQPSDVQEHLPTFVALVEQLEAQRVCELGVRGGVSTIAWLEGLRRTGGHLWGVDVQPSAPFEHRQLTFISGDDCDPAVIAQVPDDLDAIFVDTSHLYSHTVREIELWAPKVAPGGCLVFHDVAEERFDHHPDDEPAWPVRRAVMEAALELDWDLDWTERCHGLAVAWPKGPW